MFTNFCFLSHNFGSRYARKPIKSSKDSEHVLVSKKSLKQKTARSWRPGPGNLSQKGAKTCPHYDVTHTKPHAHNWKSFFNQNSKTCRIRRWFEQPSSSIGWWVMELKKVAKLGHCICPSRTSMLEFVFTFYKLAWTSLRHTAIWRYYSTKKQTF